MIPADEKAAFAPGEAPRAVILFDPSDPTRSMVPIGMHGDIGVDEDGGIEVRSPRSMVITSLAIPFLVLVIHILILVGRLLY